MMLGPNLSLPSPNRRRRRRWCFAAALMALAVACRKGAPGVAPPFRDSTLAVDRRVRDLLGRMTLEEKFWQLYMVPGEIEGSEGQLRHGIFGLQLLAARGDSGAREAAARINRAQRFFVEQTRMGIPLIPFEEAVHGLMQGGATVFPQAIALAATWDTALVGRVAGAIARESRSRGVRQVLSPVVNIASDVRWGRVEETYGEDPELASRMAVAFIRPFESAGVVATPKHFVANVGEGGRDSYPIDINRRLLEEIFFPPFKAAVREAGARSVMSSYNSVDGSPATASRWLLTEKLKQEWAFGGVVISDAAATGGANVLHDTSPDTPTSAKLALEAGLDVVFQSSVDQYRRYWEAFERGTIDRARIDDAVSRVLRLKFSLGLFEHPYVDPEDAARSAETAEHHALAREAAQASIVLLKNQGGLLPLPKSLRSLAVIGIDAEEARLGGYSGAGNRKVSILDGLRRQLGAAAEVRHSPGPGREALETVLVPSEYLRTDSAGQPVRGLRGEYFDNIELAGAPTVSRTDERIDFRWTFNAPARGIAADWYSVRWTGKLIAPTSDPVRLGVEGNDGYRLYLDGRLLIDNWRKQSYRTSLAKVRLAGGREYDVRLEYFESTGNGRVRLVWTHGVPDDWRRKIDDAVSLARRSDAAIIVVGLEEGEFRDRASLRLPGHQEALIEAVAAAGRPTVVVLVGGSAVGMSSWLDRVGAVADAWYPGEEGGDAVADVLLGHYNPAGRLPITFPISEGQLPLTYNHKPTGRGDDYLDLTGQPLFPFGFGLSFSSFRYSALEITPAAIGPDGSTVVRCKIRNEGPRSGDEVVELYLRDVLASVARPVMELKGFRRIHLDVGEEKVVTFTLAPAQLSMLDRDLRRVVEPGTFRVMIGRSSKDIRLRGMLLVR